MDHKKQRKYVVYKKIKIDEYCPFCNSQLLLRKFGYCGSNGARCDGFGRYCPKCESVIPRHYSASSVFCDVQQQRRKQKHSKAKAMLRQCQIKRPVKLKECLWRVYDLGKDGSINYHSKDQWYEYIDPHNTNVKVDNIEELIEYLNRTI